MSFAEQLREQHKARQNRLGISKAPVSFTRKPSVSIPITEKAPEPINVPVSLSSSTPPSPSKIVTLAKIQRDVAELLARLAAVQQDAEEVSKRLPSKAVILTVCKFYNIPYSEMISDRREQSVVRPRHIAMYLLKELTLRSFPAIGRAIGGRDHTTAMNGVRRIAMLIETDPELAADVAQLRSMLDPRKETSANV